MSNITDQSFIDTWINPYYMQRFNQTDEWITEIAALRKSVGLELIYQLLGYKNWRGIVTGSYFTSITQNDEPLPKIENLLFEKHLIYTHAEFMYCLASFSNEKSLPILLNYIEINFEKELDNNAIYEAMMALRYHDVKNKTQFLDNYKSKWLELVIQKADKIEEKRRKNSFLSRYTPLFDENFNKNVATRLKISKFNL